MNVIGFVSASLGLGSAARHTISSLVSSRVPVAAVDITLPDGRSGADQTWAHLNIRSTDALPHRINLVHLNPLHAVQVWQQFPAWFSQSVNAIVPFWELSVPPQDWIPAIAMYDLMLAPTQHIASVFRNLVSIPVRPYPLGVSSVQGNPSRSRFEIPPEAFAFVCAFDTDSGLNRKNSLGMIRAFDLAFHDDPTTVLVVKTNGLTKHPQLEELLARLPRERYVVIRDYLPYADVLNLYASCDAFLSLHRAEGLGLGLLEAMSLGKPVIATGWSGNLDFMDETCAAMVRFTLVPVVDPHPEYSQTRFQQTAFWAEADISHAVLQMRRVRQDADYRETIGREARRRAQARNAEFAAPAAQLLGALLEEKNWQQKNAY
ncbi:MAG TPA: glycosyltransferase [Candidatus Baltobacteraceae bacterium]|nr:glycosyltransferase [Candidatus Baltobacteraceae bacterium]